METLRTTLQVATISVIVSLLVAVVIKVIVAVLDRSPAAAPAPVVKPALTGPPPEHIAAIAAACAVLVGDHRIVHIEPRAGDTWVAEGLAVLHDHRINPHTH